MFNIMGQIFAFSRFRYKYSMAGFAATKMQNIFNFFYPQVNRGCD